MVVTINALVKSTIGVGVIGYGYWGPNLARNFAAQEGVRLAVIAETNPARHAAAAHAHPSARITTDALDLIRDVAVDAVIIATPISSHFPLAHAALEAGKHVLVEKPMTATPEQARILVGLAEQKKLTLAVDHTFIYSSPVRKIKELVDTGELGKTLYMDSVRVNLGAFQSDANVLMDLGPHDFSILTHLIPGAPVSVRAMGADLVGSAHQNVVYCHVEYADGTIAHFHWNWLSPVKIRLCLIGGSRRMVVWDDMAPSEKLKVYDKGVSLSNPTESELHKIKVDYRIGDMVAPKLDTREALAVEAAHFLDCIRSGATPWACGREGLKNVCLLDAAQRSLALNGQSVPLELPS
jgi:predicted dehydrogenase